jgi:glycosyltransferase involved in cell wall biosynthesis
MRASFVVPYLTYPAGGIREFALSAADALRRQDIDVDLADWREPFALVDRVVARAPTTRWTSARLAAHWRGGFAAEFQPGGADLVHYWHVGPAMARPPGDQPFIVTCHGREILPENVPSWQRPLLEATLGAAQFVTAVSEYTRGVLASTYEFDHNQIRVVPPGVGGGPGPAAAMGAAVPVSPERPSAGKIRIGTLSRLERRKNVVGVVEGLEELARTSDLDFTFVLAGFGSEEDNIVRRLKQSDLEWEYLGRISEEAKWTEFYPSLDVFVLTPLHLVGDVEGFGIVFLEANSCGVPVVAADTGGIGDAVAVGLSGLFADPEDPADIARQIRAVLDAQPPMRASAREWSERFSASGTALAFADLYGQALV